MIHHVIIGAGISGLYQALQLPDDASILILEQGSGIGGRIKSQTMGDGKVIELGAGIMHSNQVLITRLIEYLGLEIEAMPSATASSSLFFLDNKVVTSPLSTDILRPFVTENLSIEEIARRNLSNEDYKRLQANTKEWFEIARQNSQTFFHNEDNTGNIFKIKGGNQRLITALHQHLLRRKKHFRIRFRSSVERVVHHYDGGYIIHTSDGSTIHTPNVHLCTGLSASRRIQFSEDIPMINLHDVLIAIPTTRVYIEFQNPISWPHFLRNIVTNLPIKWAIIVSPTLIQASYTDGRLADYWGRLPQQCLVTEIVKQLDQLFPDLGIPSKGVRQVIRKYWSEGFCVVHPRIERHKYEYFQQHFPSGFYEYVSPRDYGKDQAWMESHLGGSSSRKN